MKKLHEKNLIHKKDYHFFVDGLVQLAKPKWFQPIFISIVCLAPLLNLAFGFTKMNQPILLMILLVFAISFMIYSWFNFVKQRQNFKKKEVGITKIHYFIDQNEHLSEEDLEEKISKMINEIFKS
ncbi:hypothetical protein [Bacillus sp. AFS029533]|uniref:hypothetical protein n=1 Tax=Bacillus sp. AFS029533 TaxID=2033494 RepID=UPI000BFE7F87|nr:hypothetical protein [Bacillus sp. AFS029533]PGZ90921.1 hypothetical protein COE53_16415 [Bacillus sp. AFS029533]